MFDLEKWGLVFMVLLIIGGVWAAVHDSNEWEDFKTEHTCKVVGKTTATVQVGTLTSGGIVTTTAPGKTGWLCDDGVTYWR